MICISHSLRTTLFVRGESSLSHTISSTKISNFASSLRKESFCQYNRPSLKISYRKLSVRSKEEGSLWSLDKGKLTQITFEQFLVPRQTYQKVHVDIGAGDGKYIFSQAKLHPDTFFWGIDANGAGMSYISWKAARKPSRGGGIKNIGFLCHDIERLPSLPRFADSISIQYPWASLLRAVVLPDKDILNRIQKLAKDKCSIEINLNYTVFKDINYIKRLGLPVVNELYVRNILEPAYKECHINLKSHKILSLSKPGTTWGKKLTLGGGRETLSIQGEIRIEE